MHTKHTHTCAVASSDDCSTRAMAMSPARDAVMTVLMHLRVHMGELVSAYDAVLHRMRWEWVTVGGYGGREREGGDANASAPSSVAIEQQQDLPFPFCHWFAVLTKVHVVQARTNKIKLVLLS